MKLPEAVVVERDAKMFELRRRGVTVPQIAKVMNVSETTVYNGCRRVYERIAKRQAIDWGQELRLDIERIDEMLSNVLPLTRQRVVKSDDGEDIVIPPSLDAMDRALKMMDRRAKYGNFDQISIDLKISGPGGDAPSLEAEKSTTEVSPKQEVKNLLKVMAEAGVLDADAAAALRAMMGESSEILEAEVVEDGEVEMLELEVGAVDVENQGPPAFEDDYDDESTDVGPWSPGDD